MNAAKWRVVTGLVLVVTACGSHAEHAAGSSETGSSESGRSESGSPESATSATPSDSGSTMMDAESSGGDTTTSDPQPTCPRGCDPDEVVLWQHTWGNQATDEPAVAVAIDADGTILAGGSVWQHDLVGPLAGGFLLGYDLDGNATTPEVVAQHIYGVEPTSNGASFVIGGDQAGTLWAEHRTGVDTIDWDATASGMDPGQGWSLFVLPSGTIAVGGGTPADGVIVLFGAYNTFTRLIKTPFNMLVMGIAAIDDDLVVLGWDPAFDGYYVTRMDQNGVVAWTQSGVGIGYSVLASADGTITAVMNSLGGTAELHSWTADGTPIATRVVPRESAVVWDMLELDGDLVLAGYTQSTGEHCWLGRLDASDTLTWEVWFAEENGSSMCRSITVAPEQTYIVSGSRSTPEWPNGPSSDNAWVLRIRQ